MIDRAGRQIRDLRARPREALRAVAVFEAQDCVGIRDVERVADERHAERRIEALEEHAADLGLAVAVGIAQQGDAIRARHARTGFLLRLVHEETLDAFLVLGALRRVGLRD
jgi:hypothetical protein